MLVQNKVIITPQPKRTTQLPSCKPVQCPLRSYFVTSNQICFLITVHSGLHTYLNSKMYISPDTQRIIRRVCRRNLVANLVPNTPCAPPPRVWNLVTGCLPYMVKIAIIAINKHIEDAIEHSMAHLVYYWGMLSFRGTISCFIP